MTLVTQMGGIIMPPLPSFYARPDSIEALVDYTVQRVLDQFGINDTDAYARWAGLGKAS
jgi:4-hydroxy-3-polyprenylbenzoate decarboxylase